MYKKFLFSLSLFSFTLLFLFSVSESIFATEASETQTENLGTESTESGKVDTSKFTLGNDGKAKSGDDIYKDSKINTSFKNVKYYDVAIPYAETCGTIGGFDSSLKNKYVASTVMQEAGIDNNRAYYLNSGNDFSSVYQKLIKWGTDNGGTFTLEKDTDLVIYTNKSGVQFYLTACQSFFFANTASTEIISKDIKGTANGWNSIGWGTIFDAILTDGTCIHFVYFDSNADGDTNKANDKYKQYSHVASAPNGNCIEIWGNAYGKGVTSSAEHFRTKYNYGPDDGQNKLAYYRFYNKSMVDDLEPLSDDVKGVSYSVGGGTSGAASTTAGSGNATGGTAVNSVNEANGAVALNGVYSDEMLSSYIKLHEAYLTEVLNNANRESLNQNELSSLENWNRNVNQDIQHQGLIGILRKITMALGILMVVWGVVIYVCFWVDRFNLLFDIPLVTIFSLGKLATAMTDDEANYNPTQGGGSKRTVGHKNIIKISLIAICAGSIVITGMIYTFLGWIVNLVSGLFGW